MLAIGVRDYVNTSIEIVYIIVHQYGPCVFVCVFFRPPPPPSVRVCVCVWMCFCLFSGFFNLGTVSTPMCWRVKQHGGLSF